MEHAQDASQLTPKCQENLIGLSVGPSPQIGAPLPFKDYSVKHRCNIFCMITQVNVTDCEYIYIYIFNNNELLQPERGLKVRV